MNKSKAIETFVTEMTSLLHSAKDFTMAQVPDIMQQIVHREIAFSIAGTILGLFFLVTSYISYKIFIKIHNEDKYNELAIPFGLFSAGSIVASVLIVGSNVQDFLNVYFAPKVFLIEYFAHLVK